ncbi:Hypothetical protein in Rubrerythrin cluster [hydrothermal vent metagenome]|uniref:DUF3501 domain-containing protein n=1 Tax=hydrothermal vent metagenome TaxID=652676 RepID=A0A3B0ZNQ7_9ZZZZ
MDYLNKDDLMSLEQYSIRRNEIRADAMAVKKFRVLEIGPNISIHFENRMLIQYQIQEMLHAEKTFDVEGIQIELDSYNPLIPNGSNWKATLMIAYDDPVERKMALEKLIGVEDKTWVQVDGCDRVYAIADEDMERENATKTSAVHFMRFELSSEMTAAAKSGAQILTGIDHSAYTYLVTLSTNSADSLRSDLA